MVIPVIPALVSNPPPFTAPGLAAGRSFDEGFRILVTFAANPGVTLWEVDIKPPGIAIAKAIKKTSQRNNQVHTKAAPYLKEITDADGTFEFNSQSYLDCFSLIGVNNAITFRFPDAYMLAIWGYLEDFKPENFADEKMPLAKCVIVCTNIDPVTGLEAQPVLYDPNGNPIGTAAPAVGLAGAGTSFPGGVAGPI